MATPTDDDNADDCISDDSYRCERGFTLEKGVAEMCNLSAGIERQGIEKGRAEGRDEGKTEMILEMLKENQPLDFISRISKYSKEKINEIARLHGIL